MADLREKLSARGFGAVETVAASGNVILSSDEDEQTLADDLAAFVEAEFGITGFVVVRSVDEVRSAIEDNPFHGEGSDKMVHTIFLASSLSPGVRSPASGASGSRGGAARFG